VAKTCAAFQLGNRVINGLVLRPSKRGWSVVAGAAVPLSGAEGEDLIPAYKTLARQLRLRGAQRVTLGLARQQAIIRSVVLPSTDPAELAQMARFEAERHIPFNADRHCVDFHVMRNKGVEGSDVLLTAVDGPVVAESLDGLVEAGFSIDGITISSTCLANSLLYERKEQFAKRTQAILCIGLDSLDMVFLHEGRIIYARSVALDLRGVLEGWIGYRPDSGATPPDIAKLAVAVHMIDCEKLEGDGAGGVRRWIDRAGQEVQRTYDFARREMKCPPIEAIVLTGEGASLRNLDRILTSEGGPAVELLNPVGGLAEAERQKFPFHGFEFTMAFGALLGRHRKGGYRIDLTPASHYKTLSRKTLVRRLIQTGVMLLVACGLFAYSFMSYKDLRSQELGDYKEINGQLAPAVEELRTMETKTEILRTFTDDPNAALSVFGSISKCPVIPDSVFLEKISFIKGESVIVEGRAKSIQDISRLITYLDGTGHFLPVQRSRQNPTTLENKPVYAFTLECQLRGEDDKDAGKAGASSR
jgi:Tfp pilus assembly PilM family ATPase